MGRGIFVVHIAILISFLLILGLELKLSLFSWHNLCRPLCSGYNITETVQM